MDRKLEESGLSIGVDHRTTRARRVVGVILSGSVEEGASKNGQRYIGASDEIVSCPFTQSTLARRKSGLYAWAFVR